MIFSIISWNLSVSLKNSQATTVRERIGSPSLTPIEEIAQDALGDAVNKLLDLLYENQIIVDFLGDWNDVSAYRFLTEELMDEETSNIRIEGMYSHFPAKTEEYNVQFWAEEFARGVLWQRREHFFTHFAREPFFDKYGNALCIDNFRQSVENVWSLIPAETRVSFKPITANITEGEANVAALIKWQICENQYEMESFFRLQPSPYYGWDILQTSLLNDLISMLS